MEAPAPQDKDDDIILGLLDQKEQALVDLQLMYGPALLAALEHFKPPLTEDDIEEVFAAAMLKVWNRISTFDEKKGSFRGWVFRIASNTAIDRIRKLSSDQSTPMDPQELQTEFGAEDFEEETARPPATGERAKHIAMVQDAIKALSPSEREIVLADANYPGGTVPLDLLSEWLKKPKGSLKVYRSRARAKLRTYLERKGVKPPTARSEEKK